MGWQDAPLVSPASAAKPTTAAPAWASAPVVASEAPEPSFFERELSPAALRRAAGLTARTITEGATDLIMLPGDLAVSGVNKLLGTQITTPSESRAYTLRGLPEPEGTVEKVTNIIGRGATGAATLGAGVAPQIAAAAPAMSTTQRVGAVLAQRPGLQTTAGATGAVASTAAAAAGAGPVGQAAAGLIGGGAATGAASLAAGASRRVGSALVAEPLTESGRQTIAGRILYDSARNRERSMANLSAAGEVVPGSAPTTGQTAKDAGLASLETRLRAIRPQDFSGRMSSQNQARQTLLDTIADGGVDSAIQKRVAYREQVTTKLRDQAFSEAANKGLMIERVLDDISNLKALPENQGDSVQKALTAMERQIAGDAEWIPTKPGASTGAYAVKSDHPMRNAKALYAVRKEINRILEGRYVGSDESVLRYAGGQLAKIKDSIDDTISAVAPTWEKYLTKYRQLSRPIDRAEAIKDVRQRTGLAAPDIETGREFISQAKWKQVVTKNLPELEKTLTKGQLKKINQITEDLDRGAAAASSANLRTPGSDTAANLVASGQISVANAIARLFGAQNKTPPAWLSPVSRPLSFLYKIPDEQVRQLLVDAMLDPKLAGQLMQKGTQANVQSFIESFAQQARATGVGAAVATVPEN